MKPRLFAHDLKDGTIFVALNRGDVHYPMWGGMQSEDELRGEVGRLWAAKSGGKCLFLMAFETEQGRDVRGQLDAVIG